MDKYSDNDVEIEYHKRKLAALLDNKYNREYSSEWKKEIKRSIRKKYNLKVIADADQHAKEERTSIDIFKNVCHGTESFDLYREILDMREKINLLKFVYGIQKMEYGDIDRWYRGSDLIFEMFVKVGKNTFEIRFGDGSTEIRHADNTNIDIVERFIRDICETSYDFHDNGYFIDKLMSHNNKETDNEDD